MPIKTRSQQQKDHQQQQQQHKQQQEIPLPEVQLPIKTCSQQQKPLLSSPGGKRRVQVNRGNRKTAPDDQRLIAILQSPCIHCADKTVFGKHPEVFAAATPKERLSKTKRCNGNKAEQDRQEETSVSDKCNDNEQQESSSHSSSASSSSSSLSSSPSHWCSSSPAVTKMNVGSSKSRDFRGVHKSEHPLHYNFRSGQATSVPGVTILELEQSPGVDGKTFYNGFVIIKEVEIREIEYDRKIAPFRCRLRSSNSVILQFPKDDFALINDKECMEKKDDQGNIIGFFRDGLHDDIIDALDNYRHEVEEERAANGINSALRHTAMVVEFEDDIELSSKVLNVVDEETEVPGLVFKDRFPRQVHKREVDGTTSLLQEHHERFFVAFKIARVDLRNTKKGAVSAALGGLAAQLDDLYLY